jgi:hypothetical protein
VQGPGHAPQLWLVLDEAALHRRIGEPEVMREQFAHLRQAASRPNITLQVLPYQAGTCGGNGGACVEVAIFEDGAVAVRDTKDNGSGPVLVYRRDEWAAFIAGVKDGEFELPA